MSTLIALVSLLSFASGFDIPIFKERMADRIEQLDVCAGSRCN